MSRHTPGPWFVAGYAGEHDEAGAHIKASDGTSVAHTAPEGGGGWLSYVADARLIAAAPDLLEALAGIVEIGKRDMSNPKYDGYFKSARAAIAKAGGE